MKRVDSHSIDEYKVSCKKVLKKIKREQPNISNHELKKHRGEPSIALYHPLKYFGSISEKMETKLKHYIENESLAKLREDLGNKALKTRFKPIKGETLKKMYYLKYMRSVVHPGENVGTIAG